MTTDINVQEIARTFPRDQQQPELGVIDDPRAVSAFERAFGLLVKRRKNVVAVAVSEREARGILGRGFRGRQSDFWLAVGRASPEAGLFVLTEATGPTGHADALQTLRDRFQKPHEGLKND